MGKMPEERPVPTQEQLGFNVLHLVSGEDISSSREVVVSRLRLLAMSHLLPEPIAKEILEYEKDGKA